MKVLTFRKVSSIIQVMRTTRETKRSQVEKASLVSSEEITEVFNFWKTIMGKTARAALSEERRILIGAAIHDYGMTECKEAIRGCSVSPFHMGANKQRKRYDSLELIFRNTEKVEWFIQHAEENPEVEPF